jgi:hypothetical protein
MAVIEGHGRTRESGLSSQNGPRHIGNLDAKRLAAHETHAVEVVDRFGRLRLQSATENEKLWSDTYEAISRKNPAPTVTVELEFGEKVSPKISPIQLMARTRARELFDFFETSVGRWMVMSQKTQRIYSFFVSATGWNRSRSATACI